MGRYFDENYNELKVKLHAMANLVQRVIGMAIDALAAGDVELANRTISADESIDRTEVEIDELVMKLLALQQPMAIDLRFLITALKVNNDLERMGDQAVNIAQGVVMLSEEQRKARIIDFSRMEQVVLQMVRDSIKAFTEGDAALARKVRGCDDEVDDLNRSLISQLTEHSNRHPEDAKRCISLLLITRNLERIGDLTTNIAEDVVYYIEGKIIKHVHETNA